MEKHVRLSKAQIQGIEFGQSFAEATGLLLSVPRVPRGFLFLVSLLRPCRHTATFESSIDNHDRLPAAQRLEVQQVYLSLFHHAHKALAQRHQCLRCRCCFVGPDVLTCVDICAFEALAFDRPGRIAWLTLFERGQPATRLAAPKNS